MRTASLFALVLIGCFSNSDRQGVAPTPDGPLVLLDYDAGSRAPEDTGGAGIGTPTGTPDDHVDAGAVEPLDAGAVDSAADASTDAATDAAIDGAADATADAAVDAGPELGEMCEPCQYHIDCAVNYICHQIDFVCYWDAEPYEDCSMVMPGKDLKLSNWNSNPTSFVCEPRGGCDAWVP